jgi:hypothetical protein
MKLTGLIRLALTISIALGNLIAFRLYDRLLGTGRVISQAGEVFDRIYSEHSQAALLWVPDNYVQSELDMVAMR